MDPNKQTELRKLAEHYLNVALSHTDGNTTLNEKQKALLAKMRISEQAELPGYESKNLHFGKFENRVFVVMMTDIRKSTDIINGPNGLVNMFLIFYVYAGIVAKIVDDYKGTATEFLGDGVLSLFDTKDLNLQSALRNSMSASQEILEAKEKILNPLFLENEIPLINLGIGIDHGITIVTKFGYRGDTDLKAFGKCAYNASKLCKGHNQIIVSDESKKAWPISMGGRLRFHSPILIDSKMAYPTYII